MPKAKPDSVQSIPIELQETERAALEASLAAGGIANLLHGIGAVLLPFQGAITAFAAAWLAGELADEVKEQLDKVVGGLRGSIQEPTAQNYQEITAVLYPLSFPLSSDDNSMLRSFSRGLPDSTLRVRFNAFILQTEQVMFISEMEVQTLTPSESWSLFYPWDEMLNDSIYDANRTVSRTNWFVDLITPDPK